MKRAVCIFDIDSTIANNDHRAELLQKHCIVCAGPKTHEAHSWCPTCQMETDDKIAQQSWDTFLRPDLIALDTPYPRAIEVIQQMRRHGMEFHFITGRNEKLREVTEEWLRTYVGYNSERETLKMRPLSDAKVPSSIYKEQALKELIEERDLHDASFFFFEDDPWVFKMYAKYGIVLQCPGAWEYFCPTGKHGVGPWQRR